MQRARCRPKKFLSSTFGPDDLQNSAKFPPAPKCKIQMHQMDHDNLNKSLGFSTDGPLYLSVWKNCARGSLKDVISKERMNMGAFFMHSSSGTSSRFELTAMGHSQGLHHLHQSSLGAHGYLTSRACLVDERWQVKLTLFGLTAMKRGEPRSEKCWVSSCCTSAALLWTAPELFRGASRMGTKPDDIFSFAVVCSKVKKEFDNDGIRSS